MVLWSICVASVDSISVHELLVLLHSKFFAAPTIYTGSHIMIIRTLTFNCSLGNTNVCIALWFRWKSQCLMGDPDHSSELATVNRTLLVALQRLYSAHHSIIATVSAKKGQCKCVSRSLVYQMRPVWICINMSCNFPPSMQLSPSWVWISSTLKPVSNFFIKCWCAQEWVVLGGHGVCGAGNGIWPCTLRLTHLDLCATSAHNDGRSISHLFGSQTLWEDALYGYVLSSFEQVMLQLVLTKQCAMSLLVTSCVGISHEESRLEDMWRTSNSTVPSPIFSQQSLLRWAQY